MMSPLGVRELCFLIWFCQELSLWSLTGSDFSAFIWPFSKHGQRLRSTLQLVQTAEFQPTRALLEEDSLPFIRKTLQLSVFTNAMDETANWKWPPSQEGKKVTLCRRLIFSIVGLLLALIQALMLDYFYILFFLSICLKHGNDLLCVTINAFNASIWEAEAKGSLREPNLPGLHNKFKSSQAYRIGTLSQGEEGDPGKEG